ncbi:MAG: type II/IV secretion system protein [Phycisphaerae bacterium]|nr:type II/IV secretion system protein [Phycisphaerae bacterium]
MLVEKAYLSEADLQQALRQQQQTPGGKLGRILLDLGYVTGRQLSEILAIQSGIPKVELDELQIEPEVIRTVPAELVSKYSVVPLSRQNGELTLAMADPFETQAIEELRMVTGLSIRRRYATAVEIERAIQRFYGSNVARMLQNLAPGEKQEKEETEEEQVFEGGELSAAKLQALAREPSLINLVNLVLLEAIEARASDVHIEPFEKAVKIKYRIDGLLVEKSNSPKRLQAAIISRVKIMAGMDIAERYVPQDGHIEFTGKRGKIDIRVSTVPSVFGESIVMRILDRSAALITMEDLGMSPVMLEGFSACLNRSHGIVLVTGPTGSGKTTTLYAGLNKIYDPSLKIITIEDPVEYQLDGVVQMPVNPRRGLTFARGLRHILRQDPDVVMVGEIRDQETADIAVRAALTGHLVLSTLHTNDSPGAVTRLIDMGIEPFLLSSSLEGILAQRLVRRICPYCKEPYKAPESVLASLQNSITISPDTPLYHGRGCDECNQTGMRGRVGIFELIRINDAMRKVITKRPTTADVMSTAENYHNMRHDGIVKILQGVTTPEEVLRVTQSIEDD